MRMSANAMKIQTLIDRLERERTLSDAELEELFAILAQAHKGPGAGKVQICADIPQAVCSEEEAILYAAARRVREQYYGKDVYLRGLIEFTNYCRNDCRYCGIRRSNKKAERYRLTKDQILDCCRQGYNLGFRTFVLQGGEDLSYTDAAICDIVSSIRALYPDCAITLSIGETTFCDRRLPPRPITVTCTPKSSRSRTASAACPISRNWVIKWVAGSWSDRPARRSPT